MLYGFLFGCHLLHAFKFKVLLLFYDGAGRIKWGFEGFDPFPIWKVSHRR